MKQKLLGFASLARPANLPTAAADIFAGIAIGVFAQDTDFFKYIEENTSAVLSLVFSSVFLYAGGVVFNDVFDAKLDEKERPERAIPSGVVPLSQAIIWGIILLIFGIGLAFNCNYLSGLVSIVLMGAIICYDGISKNNGFFGPLNMGICRGINLLLGISVIGTLAYEWIALVPIVYIFAITLVSRGEVHGNNKKHILFSGFFYAIVIASIAFVIWMKTENILVLSPFLLVFSFLIFRPLIKAYKVNSPKNIKKAVISGVLSLVIMNACWVAGFSGIYPALVVVTLLPLSMLLSKLFAVT